MAKKRRKKKQQVVLGIPRGGFASTAAKVRASGPTFVQKTVEKVGSGMSVGRALKTTGRTIAMDIARKATEEAKQFAYEAAVDAAGKVTERIVTKTGEIFESIPLPARPGTTTAQKFASIETNSSRRLPTLIGKNNSNKYRTSFVYGKPTSKSVKRFMSQEGKITQVLLDTRRQKNYLSNYQDQLGTITGNIRRERMTIKAGFNQRTYYSCAELGGVSYHNIKGFYNLVPSIYTPNLDQMGTVSEYGIAANHKNKISISSLNTYNACHVRVSLIARKALDFTGRTVTEWHAPLQWFVPPSTEDNALLPFESTTEIPEYPKAMVRASDTDLQAVPDKMILKYLHRTPQYGSTTETAAETGYSGYLEFLQSSSNSTTNTKEYAQCMVDPTVSWRNSPAFNKTFYVAKTFKKKLNPGDIWELDLTQKLGSGVNLTAMKSFLATSYDNLEESTVNTTPNEYTPLGYYVVIDIVGQPTIGFMNKPSGGTPQAPESTPKQEPIHGTAPSAVQVDVKTTIDLGVLTDNKGAANENSTKFATKLFSSQNAFNNLLTKIYNTDYESPDTTVYVTSDADTVTVGPINKT